MNILILSSYLDYHAEAVFWALEQSGVPVLKWTISDFPAEQGLSIRLSNELESLNAVDWSIDNKGITGTGQIGENFQTVWNRRIGRPQIDKNTKGVDKPFIISESDYARRGILSNICTQSFWVNDTFANTIYSNKINQLQLAKSVGFTIPDTIITNDYISLKDFFSKNKRVIYKAFNAPRWSDENSNQFSFTNTTIIDLDTARTLQESLRICPGIFQSYINKKYELRVTVMGNNIVTVKLNSQESPTSMVDWRAGIDQFSIEKADLPNAVRAKVQEYMKKSGLAFGCIDIIVDDLDQYVFLEINPVGQFLWLESKNPEIRMLRYFCDFITNNSISKKKFSFDSASFERFSISDASDAITGANGNIINEPKAKYQHNTIFYE